MAPSATVTQSMSAKVKRPVPPGIQTNGINSSTSSPSPSMSAGRLPNATPRNTSGSAASNGVPNGSAGPRSASRIRRDTPAQLLGRGQRNSSVGLRSASLMGESAMIPAGPQPYSKLCTWAKEIKPNLSSLDRRVYLIQAQRQSAFVDNPPTSKPFPIRSARGILHV